MKVGAEDSIVYMLHQSCSHWDRDNGALRIIFVEFSNVFNTIQPMLIRDKRAGMGVGPHLVARIMSYLIGRPAYVCLGDCWSDTVISNIGAPQRTVLSLVLFMTRHDRLPVQPRVLPCANVC